MFLRLLLMNSCSFCFNPLVSHQVSEPYRNTASTFDLKTLHLVLVVSAVDRHIGLNIPNACLAFPTFVSEMYKMCFTRVMWLPWFHTVLQFDPPAETEQWNEKFGLNMEYFFQGSLFCLLCNISSTRDSVSSGYPNTKKRIENMTRSGVFLKKFKVFG